MSTNAELSSIARSLIDLTARVTNIANNYATEKREDLASELFDVERALDTANRRFEKVLTHYKN